MQWPARILAAPLAMIAALAAWLALAPFTPHVAYWGAESLVSPQYAGPLLLISLGVAAASAALARASRANLLPAALGVVATAAAAALFGGQLHAARALGTDADAWAALSWAGLDKTAQGPDATVPFDLFGTDELDMDVYLPREGGPRPVLLYTHGGGWDQLNKRSQAYNMRQMADRGYVVVSMDYTLSSREQPTWDVAAGEVGCAFTWVGAHAADYGGDPARFFTYGESAGGQLLLDASYDAAAGTLTSDCGGRAAVPRAVYADSPALDARAVWGGDDPYAGRGARETVEKYLGGTPGEYPARADAVTSANHVTDRSQPTMIVRSADDRLVPPGSYEGFHAAAAASGVELTEQVRPHADHASALSAHGVWNQHLLDSMTTFFAEHGADA